MLWLDGCESLFLAERYGLITNIRYQMTAFIKLDDQRRKGRKVSVLVYPPNLWPPGACRPIRLKGSTKNIMDLGFAHPRRKLL